MKKTLRRALLLPGTVLLTAALGLILAGCEASSPDQAQIAIEPAHADIAVGQSITLNASGWHSYKWGLNDNNIGRLSATTGRSVTYTATGGGTQTVTASAPTDAAPSSSTTSTNNPPQTSTTIAVGTATIKH